MNQERYIYKLLFEHDCVIVPGFGGFIGNYAAAQIHPLRHEFFPPGKSLLFNPNLKQNDGLLAMAISTGEKITFEDAVIAVKSLVSQWNRELGAGLSVTIEHVGRLYRDQEGNLQFEQDKEVNFLAESYGLNSFISPVISRREPVEEKKTVTLPVVSQPVDSSYEIPRIVKWAAFLALPLGTAALFGLSHFDRVREFSVAYSGILFSSPATETTRPLQPSKPKATPAVTKEIPKERITVTATPAPLKQAEEVTVKPFMIIVGAFRFVENANSLVATLREKGYNATMAGQTRTGLYRVSLCSCKDKSEAIRQLDIVRSGEFASAWLLVK